MTWDSASDASNNPASGSMKITANFGDQFEVFNGFDGINPPLNGLQYTNFQCDVRFATNSATVISGGVPIFGHLEFGTRQRQRPGLFWKCRNIQASNTNWVHVSFALNALTDPNLMTIYDVLIHIYGKVLQPGIERAFNSLGG